MKKFFKEFKEFINRGNVMDMAVGIIIGGAFTSIVSSLVEDIINPFLMVKVRFPLMHAAVRCVPQSLMPRLCRSLKRKLEFNL